MLALYNGLSASDKVLFEQAYCASYHALQETINECYEEARAALRQGLADAEERRAANALSPYQMDKAEAVLRIIGEAVDKHVTWRVRELVKERINQRTSVTTGTEVMAWKDALGVPQRGS